MLVFYQLDRLNDWPKERVEAIVFNSQTVQVRIISSLNQIQLSLGSVFVVQVFAISSCPKIDGCLESVEEESRRGRETKTMMALLGLGCEGAADGIKRHGGYCSTSIVISRSWLSTSIVTLNTQVPVLFTILVVRIAVCPAVAQLSPRARHSARPTQTAR